jgi:hypothetical protein
MNYPFKRVITDIKNYFFIRKIIKKNIGTIEWEKFKLRVDWIGRIYTVVNLPPEVIYSPDSPEEIRPAYILEESRPLNEYLTRLNLQEIIMPEITPIPNTISYLLIYTPYFQRLSLKWILYRLGFILVLWWLQYKFGLVSLVYDWIKYLFLDVIF